MLHPELGQGSCAHLSFIDELVNIWVNIVMQLPTHAPSALVDAIQHLNARQREAVETTEGPLLILAGPGAGKTQTLTTRIARLIAMGVPREAVLAVTFTNKAAEEMRERVTRLLDDRTVVGSSKSYAPYPIPHAPFIGTFHALAVRILRAHALKIGYTPSFTIFDKDDSLSLVKRISKSTGTNPKQFPPGMVLGIISGLKGELITSDQYAEREGTTDFFPKHIHPIYETYQQELRQANAMDFDDLLLNVNALFDAHPDILTQYQQRFRYIHVDEYQDTNHAQYTLTKRLAEHSQNIAVVGDDAQCFPPGTKILTTDGQKNIEELAQGAQVLGAAGHGALCAAKISKIKTFRYDGPVIVLRTASNRTLTLTPNHILFTRLPLSPNTYFVYLMFRKDKGFRIGIAKGARIDRKGRLEIGLLVRSNQEKADKMWVLRVCDARTDAEYWEYYYAFSYGIPSLVFDTGNRSMKLGQQSVDRLFAAIDTEARARRLMRDLLIDANHPHWLPQGTIRGNSRRLRIRIAMFDDRRRSAVHPWSMSRLSINTKDTEMKKRIERLGFKTRKGKLSDWRLEVMRLRYDQIEQAAATIQQHMSAEVEIVKRACVTNTGKRFSFQPASHIRRGMIVGVHRNGAIEEETVDAIEVTHYKGAVYDLDIEHLHNYVANGVVVHNSIYGFRGADYRNILNFEKDWPHARVVVLDQNYRSTQQILDAATAVIRQNVLQKQKRLWAKREGGSSLRISAFSSEREEADFVREELQELIRSGNNGGGIAVLYRTNAQSRAFEEALIEANIPYRLVGGVRFYERKEVKDLIAYLRALANPRDFVSLGRIANIPPRGIGKRTFAALIEALAGTEASISPMNNRAAAFMELFAELRDAMLRNPPSVFLKTLMERMHYREYLEARFANADERWENAEELANVAIKYDHLAPAEGVVALLEDIALMSDADDVDPSASRVHLMTLHAAKGLEFDTVFLVGMEEGILPHAKATLKNADLEEERRLCYVGLTRARDLVYLTLASTRRHFGAIQANPPSRFLSEIPAHLLVAADENIKSIDVDQDES